MTKLTQLIRGFMFGAVAITAPLFVGCGSSEDNSGIGDFNPKISYGTLTDPRDGQDYRTVEIGNSTWMAENLKYAEQACGTSWCYGNNASYCKTYGRLYDWCAAMTACPDGWHLPTDADWKNLVLDAGGTEDAAGNLKSKKGWNDNGNGTDEHGFSALPGGYGRSDLRTFIGVGYSGFWWSATELDAWLLGSDNGVERRTFGSEAGLSVRCVQD